MPLTLADYLMGRDKQYPITDEMRADAIETVKRLNMLLILFRSYRRINSGYRPAEINEKIQNAAKHSNHIVCRAADLDDSDGRLDFFCITNQKKLENIGLWLEHPIGTPGWCHVQIVPPMSGHRVFIA